MVLPSGFTKWLYKMVFNFYCIIIGLYYDKKAKWNNNDDILCSTWNTYCAWGGHTRR